MPVSHAIEQRSRPGFVVTRYHADGSGTLVPEMPEACPWRKEEGRCRLWVHHRRIRKTGPCFPLTVVECGEHGHAFTLYPPGYAPYQRAAVIKVAPDGGRILTESEGGKAKQRLTEAFGGTLFQAALDARSGHAWARVSDEVREGEGYWANQCRALNRGSRLLGLSSEVSRGTREKIAAVLGVAALLLHELAERLRRENGYRQRGHAICLVLEAMRLTRETSWRLLSSGFMAGEWSEPLEWDRRRRHLRRSAFSGLSSERPP